LDFCLVRPQNAGELGKTCQSSSQRTKLYVETNKIYLRPVRIGKVADGLDNPRTVALHLGFKKKKFWNKIKKKLSKPSSKCTQNGRIFTVRGLKKKINLSVSKQKEK